MENNQLLPKEIHEAFKQDEKEKLKELFKQLDEEEEEETWLDRRLDRVKEWPEFPLQDSI